MLIKREDSPSPGEHCVGSDNAALVYRERDVTS